MTWSPILAFAIIALAFGIGDVIAAKTRGVISSGRYPVVFDIRQYIKSTSGGFDGTIRSDESDPDIRYGSDSGECRFHAGFE